MTDVSRFPFIWCDNCDGIQPVILDELPADYHNERPALDLVCSRCKVIIATLHSGLALPKDDDALGEKVTPANFGKRRT